MQWLEDSRIAIVGAGICGPAVGNLLSRAGHDVVLYERFENPQSLSAGLLPQAIGESIVDAITYIRDSGILHALLDLSIYDGLLGHPVSGNGWEGFVIESILSICPRHVDAYFYRTATGNEIDLLSSYADELMAIEIKRSTAPKLTKGFHIACDDINPTSKWVVHLGDDEYRLTNDITVLPLANMMEYIINKLA